MGWFMNGDPWAEPERRGRGRPVGSRDSKPRQRSDTAKRKAEAEKRRKEQDGTL